MKGIRSTVSTTIRATAEATFDYIAPVDLRSIFKGYGPLPAVVGSVEQTGAWDAPGQTRRVVLSDGSSAQEELTEYDRPRHFAYRVSGFSGILGLLAHDARVDWWFNAAGGATNVKWTYTFAPRSSLTWPVLWLVGVLWARYMGRAIELCRVGVEGAA